MYYGARYYDPWVGRFCSQDPGLIGNEAGVSFGRLGADPQQFNSYSYGRNNPTKYVDRGGEFLETAFDVASAGLSIGIAISDPTAGNIAGAVFDVVAVGVPFLPGGFGVVKVAGKAAGKAAEAAVDVARGAEKAADAAKAADKAGDATKAATGASKSADARAGKSFTQKGKKEVIADNAAQNGGQATCKGCGTKTTPATQSTKGVSPSPNETRVDHIEPMSKGGAGDPSNGQVLCSSCNLDKGNKTDWIPPISR